MTRDNSTHYQVPYVFVTDRGVENYFEQRTGVTLERYANAQECYFLAGLEGMNSILIDMLLTEPWTGVGKHALNEYRQLKKTVSDLMLLNVREYQCPAHSILFSRDVRTSGEAVHRQEGLL